MQEINTDNAIAILERESAKRKRLASDGAMLSGAFEKQAEALNYAISVLRSVKGCCLLCGKELDQAEIDSGFVAHAKCCEDEIHSSGWPRLLNQQLEY